MVVTLQQLGTFSLLAQNTLLGGLVDDVPQACPCDPINVAIGQSPALKLLLFPDRGRAS